MFTKSLDSSHHHHSVSYGAFDRSMDWYEYYLIAKSAGDKLLQESIVKGHVKDNSQDDAETNFAALFINVFYHWGIAFKIGFSNVTQSSPGSTHVKRKALNKTTQDLVYLAESAGLFSSDDDSSKVKANHDVFRKALLLLEDIIRWNERYPYHTVSSIISKLQSKIPFLITCGLNFIIIIKPLFDFLETEITNIMQV